MGLIRRMYDKREMRRALLVLGGIRPDEVLITTNIANFLSPRGAYVEGLFALTSRQLAFRSTVGLGFGAAVHLANIADVNPTDTPFLLQVGIQIHTDEGDVLTASTSNDFVGIFLYTVAMVRLGRRIDDPVALLREALIAWGSSPD